MRRWVYEYSSIWVSDKRAFSHWHNHAVLEFSFVTSLLVVQTFGPGHSMEMSYIFEHKCHGRRSIWLLSSQLSRMTLIPKPLSTHHIWENILYMCREKINISEIINDKICLYACFSTHLKGVLLFVCWSLSQVIVLTPHSICMKECNDHLWQREGSSGRLYLFTRLCCKDCLLCDYI